MMVLPRTCGRVHEGRLRCSILWYVLVSPGRDQRSDGTFGSILPDKADRAIGQGYVKTVLEQPAQLGERFVGIVRDVLRLGPWHRLSRFDNQESLRSTVLKTGRIARHDHAVKRRVFADEDLVVSAVRFRRRPSDRSIHLWHLLQQFFVVLTVPRFIQMELVVKVPLLNIREDGHAPAEQR